MMCIACPRYPAQNQRPARRSARLNNIVGHAFGLPAGMFGGLVRGIFVFMGLEGIEIQAERCLRNPAAFWRDGGVFCRRGADLSAETIYPTEWNEGGSVGGRRHPVYPPEHRSQPQ